MIEYKPSSILKKSSNVTDGLTAFRESLSEGRIRTLNSTSPGNNKDCCPRKPKRSQSNTSLDTEFCDEATVNTSTREIIELAEHILQHDTPNSTPPADESILMSLFRRQRSVSWDDSVVFNQKTNRKGDLKTRARLLE